MKIDDKRQIALTTTLLIDSLCDRFEDAWRSNDFPRIEDFLGELDEPTRSQLLHQLLQVEVEYRYLQGNLPCMEEYLHRFPTQQTFLEELLSSVAASTNEIERQFQSTKVPSTISVEGHRRNLYLGKAVSQLKRYQVLRRHAEGGLGKVSIARDCQLNREVALKEIKPRFSADRDSQARFIAEAEISGSLEHPGIVPVYALDQHEDGRPYYVMRFVRGESLRDAIQTLHPVGHDDGNQPMPSPMALRKLLRRFLEVCNTVAYAHSRGVIHRDLKPQNIMLGPFGETLVVDWGLAKTFGVPDDHGITEKAAHAVMPRSPVDTQFGRIVGTPGYMSPEQADGTVQLTPACDVYGLGATLYCLLTGRAPRSDAVQTELIAATRSESCPSPRQLVPRLPRALDAISLKAMRVLPDQRYASASALAEDIEAWLEDEPVSCYRETTFERVGRWTRKNRSWVAVAGVALAIIAVVAVVSAVTVDRVRRRETVAREQATENLQTSLDAIDKMLTEVGSRRLAGIPLLTPVRQGLLDEALRLLESINRRQSADAGLQHYLARVSLGVARLALWTGAHQRAAEILEQAMTTIEVLRTEFPERHRYTIDLIDVQLTRAFLYQERDQWDLAEKCQRRALQLLEQLPGEVRLAPENQLQRPIALGNLAFTLSHQDRIDEAESYYLQSKSLFVETAALDDFRNHRYEATRMLLNFGRLLSQAGKPDEARSTFSQALEYCQELVAQEPVYPRERQLLARVHEHLAELVWHDEGPHKAAEIARQELEQRERLAAEFPSAVGFQHDLAMSFANLAYYLSQRPPDVFGTEHISDLKNRKKEITTLYRQSIDIMSGLATTNPGVPRYQASLAQSYNNQGIFYLEIGDLAAGVDAYTSAMQVQKGIIAQFGESSDRLSTLGGTLNNLALVLAGKGELTVARDRFHDAIQYQQMAIAANKKNPTYRSFLRNHYSGLGVVYTLLGSTEEALHVTRQCVRLADQLYQDQGDIGDYRAQLNSQCSFLARLLADAQGNRQENLESARDLVQGAAARSPHWRSYQVQLAEIEFRLGNLEPALQALEQAQSLEPDPSDLPYELLIKACLLYKQGKESQAHDAFCESTELAESLIISSDIYDQYSAFVLDRLKAETAELLGVTQD